MLNKDIKRNTLSRCNMESEYSEVDTRLNAIEKGMQEILMLLRQVIPSPTKEDFLKHCGINGIFVIDEWNKRAKQTVESSKKQKNSAKSI